MFVKNVMTTELRTCTPATNVAAAASLMLDGDCGFLPVVDEEKLIGVVTDRDLFVALATRDRRASELTIAEVAQAPVHTCGPDDTLEAALETMTRHRVRRLPVEGFAGRIIGVVSLNDITRSAGTRNAVRDGDVTAALRAIGAHHHPAPHVAAA